MALAKASTFRLSVPPDHRSPLELEALGAVVSSHPDVEAVDIDVETGTILIVGAGGREVGGAIADLLDAVAAESAPNARAGLQQAVRTLRSVDGRIQGRTRGLVSLRWVVPAAAIGLGLRIVMARHTGRAA